VIVDAHLHRFRPAAISPRAVDTLAPADRDASVEELLELHRSFGVARAVMVPLGPEDGYLGEVLRRYPTRFAGVAVASSATEGRDPDADPVDDLMRRREAVPFHGLRALWLGDPARRLAESPMLSVLRRMQELGMVLWSYLPEEQLDLLDQLAAMMPDLPVVLNHFGFCPRAMQVDRLGRPWFKQPLPLQTLPKVLHLASYSRVHLMFSGQYAFSREDPPYRDLGEVVFPLLEAFGSHRTMWASDWPWIRESPGYDALLSLPPTLLSGASSDELADVMGGTALRLFPHLASTTEN
jgi:L-fuconolactonase